MSQETVNLIFYGCATGIWVLLMYYVLLTVSGYRYSRYAESHFPALLGAFTDLPSVSVLIPAHNEERVIGETVHAVASLDYPADRFEVVVVNDGSTDATGDILHLLRRRYPALRVIDVPVAEGGRGKAAALNRGLAAARGDVIAVYDGDNRPDRYALRYLVGALLEDPTLGATVGKVRTLNRHRTFMSRAVNVEFIGYQWIFQAGRAMLSGFAAIPGTNYVIWRRLLERLGGWDPLALTEDLELSVRVYESGSRIRFVPLARTWEQEPEELRVWVRQRTRWMRGNNYVVRKSLRKLFSAPRSVVLAELLHALSVFYIFLISVLISDALFLAGLLGWIRLTVPGPFLFLWVFAYVLFILQFLIALVIEGEDHPRNVGIVALMYFTYAQLWIYVALRSLLLPAPRPRPAAERISVLPPVWERTKRY